MNQPKFTNSLAKESSPYLQQHAHNPVNWYAWNEETLELARKENKLLLISIGYSTCHWCHVMEEESFENEDVAKIMNQYFINVKVDREERPDVDQIYMNAVQLMTGQGGWPLNCIALPNGKPVWGGTYFRKEEWIKTLYQIGELYLQKPEKVVEYAEKLTLGIQQHGLIQLNKEKPIFSKKFIEETIQKWEIYFDEHWGGTGKAPKFAMPNNYHFLLRNAYQNNNESLKKYVHNTLNKIALGGIFDHVGGGFCRYSVDAKWHIPHFEKMLYDNGQMVSLYADAFLASKKKLYKETVYETLKFVERELLDQSGGFYSALDADSINKKGKLEEGAFYVWTKEELKKHLSEDFSLFSDYYNVNEFGFWEHDNYHLIRSTSDKDFSTKHNIKLVDFKKKVAHWKEVLLTERSKRKTPRLDDKILTSWNGIMLKGYVDAYRVFNDEHFLEIALKNAQFLEQYMLKEDGTLYRNYKDGKTTINAYLEDYANLIDAYIALYEVCLDEKWLHLAKNLTDTSFDYFFDTDSKMFFFTSNKDAKLIARKMEIEDNVIPASNSIMAKNLFKLSHYFGNQHYLKTSKQMLTNMLEYIPNYGAAYSNWLDLYSNFTDRYFEIAVSGADALKITKELHQEYIPNKLICGSSTDSDLALLKNRFTENNTLIYVCVNNACQLPVKETGQAIEQIKNLQQ